MKDGSGGTVALREWGGAQSFDEKVIPMDSSCVLPQQSMQANSCHRAIAPGGGALRAKERVKWSEQEEGVGLHVTQKARIPPITHAW